LSASRGAMATTPQQSCSLRQLREGGVCNMAAVAVAPLLLLGLTASGGSEQQSFLAPLSLKRAGEANVHNRASQHTPSTSLNSMETQHRAPDDAGGSGVMGALCSCAAPAVLLVAATATATRRLRLVSQSRRSHRRIMLMAKDDANEQVGEEQAAAAAEPGAASSASSASVAPAEAGATSSDALSEPSAPSASSSTPCVAAEEVVEAAVASAPEALVEELEGKMQRLAREEKYSEAAAVRDELSDKTLDDDLQVLNANTELYDAFSKRSLDRMKAIWLPASYVQCIHPYEKRSMGYTKVCESWKRLFTAAATPRSSISAEDINVTVRGATATVVCLEQVISKSLKQPLRSMLATNVFRKADGKWLLVHRHVSSVNQEDGMGHRMLTGEPMEMDSEQDALMRAIQLCGKHAGIIMQKGKSSRGFGMMEEEDDDDTDFDDDEGYPSEVLDADLDDLSDTDESLGTDEDSDMDLDGDLYVEDEGDPMEAARDTVRALRRLSKEGKLDPKARIQLLGEMLRSPGDSMPERAHELLLSEIEEDERKAAWEDFASLISMEALRLDPPVELATGAVEAGNATAGHRNAEHARGSGKRKIKRASAERN